VVNFDGDIKDFVVGKSKLFVLTDYRLHQMRLDLLNHVLIIILNPIQT